MNDSEAQSKHGNFLFSPWHRILSPIALAMLIPMLWMLVTSVETLSETRHFPPSLFPHTFRPANYTDVLRQAPFARWSNGANVVRDQYIHQLAMT